MFEFWLNLFRLTRPLSNVKNIAIVCLAFYLSGAPLNWSLFILGALSLSLNFSGIYAYNTACDAGLDKKNDNKKHYLKAVEYFGKAAALVIAFILFFLSLILALAVNVYFFSALIAIILTGVFYSGAPRFKEKFLLDILFGASLTILLRFVASWFIFSVSFPPLLPMLGLIFLKTGGYMLYKGYDRPFLIKSGVKNSITILRQKTILIVSGISFTLSILFFILLCLNSYFNIAILGSLPIKFIFFIILFIPPIIAQYLLFLEKIKIKGHYLRVAGFVSMLLIIVLILLVLR